MKLPGVSTSNSDVQVSIVPQQVPTGTGTWCRSSGDRSARRNYRAVANLRSNGTVSLTIVRVDAAGQATIVPAQVVSGSTYAAGDKINVRMQVTGVTPTVLQAKAWKSGQTEPAPGC